MLNFASLPKHDNVESVIKSALPDGVNSIEFGDGALAGIGGGGASSSAKATASLADGSKKHLFVKILRNDSHAKVWEDKLDIFKKEITFYQQILPALTSNEDVFEFVPRFLGAGTIGTDVYVVLEDFASVGYSVVKADTFIEEVSVEACMKGIARFHALSRNKKDVLEKFSDPLRDRINAAENEETVKQVFCVLLETNLRLLKAVLEAKEKLPRKINIPKSVDINLLNELIGFAPRMLRVFRHLRSPSSESDLGDFLIHGDYHMWNVALKGDQMKMFDFQIVCRGSPGCDLQHFMSQSPNPDSKRLNWKKWLQIYRQEFNQRCPENKIDAKELEEDFVNKAPIGFICGVAFNLRRFVSDADKSSVEDAEKIAKENGASDELVGKLVKCGDQFWKAIQWNFDMVHDYCVEMDGIETIRSVLG